MTNEELQAQIDALSDIINARMNGGGMPPLNDVDLEIDPELSKPQSGYRDRGLDPDDYNIDDPDNLLGRNQDGSEADGDDEESENHSGSNSGESDKSKDGKQGEADENGEPSEQGEPGDESSQGGEGKPGGDESKGDQSGGEGSESDEQKSGRSNGQQSKGSSGKSGKKGSGNAPKRSQDFIDAWNKIISTYDGADEATIDKLIADIQSGAIKTL